MTERGFALKFDPNPSNRFPQGYWYAVTLDGSYDAVGATVEAALANLVLVLHEALSLESQND